MQTDACFYPVGQDTTLQKRTAELAAREWVQLRTIRDGTRMTLARLGGALYDLIAWKNVVFHSSSFAAAPLTDLLLVVSKLHRHSTVLVKQLATFFGIVFADGVADETYHFAELALTRKELRSVASALEAARSECTHLKARVASLEAREAQQRRVVERLEVANSSLEVRSASLEDQMSLLFEQLADDFVFYNEEQLRHAAEDSKLHERMTPVRSAFSQGIDAVHNRLRSIQDMLTEVAADMGDRVDEGPSQSSKQKADKSKLKSLEVHLHHLSSRFGAVRDGLQQTAQELHTALLDKKKVVNFAVQHLKAYEMQNQKLRVCRLRLHELRQGITHLRSSFQRGFPQGTPARIDVGGNIVHLARRSDGEEDETAAGANTARLAEMVEQIEGDARKVQDVLATQDEHRQLMRAVSMAVPSGPRKDQLGPAPTRQQLRQQVQAVHEALAIVPVPGGQGAATGAPSSSGDGAAQADGAGAAVDATSQPGGNAQFCRDVCEGLFGPISDEQLAQRGSSSEHLMSREELYQMKRELARKVAFMREVYEDRIRMLESKTETLARKLIAAQQSAGRPAPQQVDPAPGAAQARDDSDAELAIDAKRRWVQKREQLVQSEAARRNLQLGALQRLDYDSAAPPAAEERRTDPNTGELLTQEEFFAAGHSESAWLAAEKEAGDAQHAAATAFAGVGLSGAEQLASPRSPLPHPKSLQVASIRDRAQRGHSVASPRTASSASGISMPAPLAPYKGPSPRSPAAAARQEAYRQAAHGHRPSAQPAVSTINFGAID